jgi:hypothetical protein
MQSQQMTNLLRRYHVDTEPELLDAIAREDAEMFDMPLADARSIADVILDGMLEAEYQRIEGGAYDPSTRADEPPAPVADLEVDYDENTGTEDELTHPSY